MTGLSSGSESGPGIGTRLLATAAVLLAAALAGCSSDSPTAAGSPTGPTTGPTSAPATGSAGPSTNPTSLVKPVPGATPLTASSGLRKVVNYDDQVTVKITKVEGTKIAEALGPGDVAGQEITIFTLRFDNGSSNPLDLNNVRVTALYGSDETAAPPSYYGELNDFFGVVAPSGSLETSYGFVLSGSQLSDVKLRVLFDENHSTALFAGSLH